MGKEYLLPGSGLWCQYGFESNLGEVPPSRRLGVHLSSIPDYPNRPAGGPTEMLTCLLLFTPPVVGPIWTPC